MPRESVSRLGDVNFPVAPADLDDDQSLWSVGDPARDRLIDLFRASITSAHEAVWNVARVGTALDQRAPVAMTTYRQPDRNLLSARGTTFPLLAIYRTEQPQEYEPATLSYSALTCTWRLEYFLGPLNEADFRRLGGILELIPRHVAEVIRKRGHSSFEAGSAQFGEGKGGFLSVILARHRTGVATIADEGEGLELHMVSCELETREREEPFANVERMPLLGVDIAAEVGGDA